MKVYLDENFTDRILAGQLRKAGHTVVQPADAGLRGASDARHFEYAIREGLILLTKDREDFRDLHQLVMTSGGSHPGVLVVAYENDAARDMKSKHIVAAIGKLERSGVPLTGQIAILNQWR